MASTTVTVVNQGSAAVNVSQISVSGQAFSINGASNLPITVPAGGTYSLSVNFVPAAMGADAGQLMIASDATSDGTLVVGLSGTGTAAGATTNLELTSLSCAFDGATGSAIDNCTVTLNSAAPSGGLAVSLSSNNSAVTVPTSVTVQAGSTTASFTADVSAVSATATATLTASAGSVAQTFNLQLNAVGQVGTNSPILSGLYCGSSSVTGPGTDNCTATLNAPAASGGFAVSLASNNSAVSVPVSITVAAGATTGSFTATIAAVTTAQVATLTANAGGVAETFALQLNAGSQVGTSAPELSGLSCGSSSITGGGTNNCTITLTGPAPSGGFPVSLASNSSSVSVPASITVAAGVATGSFTATITAVNMAQTATLTASAGGVVETFALQLGVSMLGLSVNGTSIAFGNVSLNTPATQTVTLTSTGTAGVTISLATVIGSGFTISGATFPLTLGSSQSVTISVLFDPTVAGAASGTLTIVSTSLTNPTTIVSLSGTGVVAIAYAVNLTWDAPANSATPVAGYNVYRSPSGASTYVQMNSSLVTQAAYADSTVQDEQTYDYIVESVDSSGLESAPSNTATVAVP